MYTLNEKINMKYFNKKLDDNDSKAWKLIVKLFQGKDVKGNENFLGIERTITRARNNYDTASPFSFIRNLWKLKNIWNPYMIMDYIGEF